MGLSTEGVRDSPLGSSADSQGVPGAPEPEELVPAARAFRERPLCADRGSFMGVDPAKPACAQVWKHPQALTCLPLSLSRMLQEERIPSGCQVLGFSWQKALWGPRGICCARNKPVHPCSTADWEWLVLEKQPPYILSGYHEITFLRLGNVWFPLQHPGEEGPLSWELVSQQATPGALFCPQGEVTSSLSWTALSKMSTINISYWKKQKSRQSGRL